MTRYNIEETALYDKYVRWCGRTGSRGPSYPIPFFYHMHNRQGERLFYVDQTKNRRSPALGTGRDAVETVVLGDSLDSVGVGGWLIMKCLTEFRRIEHIGVFVLIEHLVQFPNRRIKPSREPEHRSSENTVPWLRSELAC